MVGNEGFLKSEESKIDLGIEMLIEDIEEDGEWIDIMVGGLRGGIVGKVKMLDGESIRSDEKGIVILIILDDIIMSEGGRVGNIGRIKIKIDDIEILRRIVILIVRLKIGIEKIIWRWGNGVGILGRKIDIVGDEDLEMIEGKWIKNSIRKFNEVSWWLEDMMEEGEFRKVLKIIIGENEGMEKKRIKKREVEIEEWIMEGGILGGKEGNGVMGKEKMNVEGWLIKKEKGGKMGKKMVIEEDWIGMLEGEKMEEMMRKENKMMLVGKEIIGRDEIGIKGCKRGVEWNEEKEEIRDEKDRKD